MNSCYYHIASLKLLRTNIFVDFVISEMDIYKNLSLKII